MLVQLSERYEVRPTQPAAGADTLLSPLGPMGRRPLFRLLEAISQMDGAYSGLLARALKLVAGRKGARADRQGWRCGLARGGTSKS